MSLIIVRYILDNKIEKRFIGFFDVSKNKTATGSSEVILNELSKWNVDEKKMEFSHIPIKLFTSLLVSSI